MGENVNSRTLKTRKALRNALAELLTGKELHKVTVQEIADKADVNRVTFYKHYQDVFDLYDKMEEETLIELGLLALRLEELPTEAFFTQFLDYISDNRVIFGMVFSPNSTGQLRAKLSNMIEGIFRQVESEKTGTPIMDSRLSYLSRYRAQGCLAVISMWVRDGFHEPQAFIVKTISELDSSTESCSIPHTSHSLQIKQPDSKSPSGCNLVI